MLHQTETMNILNVFLLSPRCSNRSKDRLEVKAEQFIRKRSSTRGCLDSWRKAVFRIVRFTVVESRFWAKLGMIICIEA
jgi:hypothetical protein